MKVNNIVEDLHIAISEREEIIKFKEDRIKDLCKTIEVSDEVIELLKERLGIDTNSESLTIVHKK